MLCLKGSDLVVFGADRVVLAGRPTGTGFFLQAEMVWSRFGAEPGQFGFRLSLRHKILRTLQALLSE